MRFSIVITKFWVIIEKKSSSIKALHERELCNRSRTHEQSFVLLYRVTTMGIDNILMRTFEVYSSMLYQGDYLLVNACYLWEISLNLGVFV
jgi:hypothetical protein